MTDIELSGKKYKIGDRIKCIETPLGPHDPRIKKGNYAVVHKAKDFDPHKAEPVLMFVIEGKKNKKYAYWIVDDHCYTLAPKVGTLEAVIEREVEKLK